MGFHQGAHGPCDLQAVGIAGVGVAAVADDRAGMAASMGAMGSGWPITPVEATTTSEAGIPETCSRSAHMPLAMSIPSALQVLALPLLQRTARAYAAAYAPITISPTWPCW